MEVLLFDGLDVKPDGKFDHSPAGGAWFGLYIDDGGAPVALCGVDAPLAASPGAALSMLPPGFAKEAATMRTLSEPMRDNLREVMNICTRLAMSETSPHLKLEDLYAVKALPAPAATLLSASGGHREFQLQLPKYGGGVFTLISA